MIIKNIIMSKGINCLFSLSLFIKKRGRVPPFDSSEEGNILNFKEVKLIKKSLNVLLILNLSLGLTTAIFAQTQTGLIRSTITDDTRSESFQSPELLELAREFRKWRRSLSAGIPNFIQRYFIFDTDVEENIRRLEEFRSRLEAINPRSWAIPAQVDYLVLQIEMNHVEFKLKVIRQVSRNPDFYTTWALRGVSRYIGGRHQRGAGITVPYDKERAEAIIQALNDTPKIVGQAPRLLTEAVPEMADMAIERLENVRENYREFAKVIGQHLPAPYRNKIGPAADKAGKALEDYREWLVKHRPQMNAPFAIGREAFEWFVKNVLVMPYNSEQLIQQALMERHRNWMFLQYERQKNRHLPRAASYKDQPTRAARDNQEYIEWKDATDVMTRIWAEKYDLFTIPDYASGPQRNIEGGIWIEPFGMMSFPEDIKNYDTEFLVNPDHWFSDIYWEIGHRLDPGVNHPHSNIPGHAFENKVSQQTCREIRKGHNTRGDSWTMLFEEAQLQLDYPFVRGPLVREWMYSLAIMRAERIYVAVKFADGSMKPDEVPEHMMKTVPWMEPHVAKKHELWRKFISPAQVLTYQVGKFEVFKLIRDMMMKLGDDFDLREFHDQFLATGQIPVPLARWEMTGIDEDCKHLWDNEPIPVKK